jgi:hypothetical protein
MVDDNGAITPLSARTLSASIGGMEPGKYSMTVLDIDGKAQSESRLDGTTSLMIQVPLPAATTTSESGVFLARITPHP